SRAVRTVAYCRDVNSTDAGRWAWPRAMWHRMGLSGTLLAAAVVADILVAAATALAEGDSWHPLVMLPGALGLAGCALLGRRQPLIWSLLGAAVLLAVSPIGAFRPVSYVALLDGISISETVAGVQLVVLAQRLLPRVKAVTATSALVIACVAAIGLRASSIYSADPSTWMIGLALLVGAVILGLRTRDGAADTVVLPELGPYVAQWPLIGGFALVVFVEFASSSGSIEGILGLLCSLAAATLAIVATRHPVTAGAGLAGVIVLTALLTMAMGSFSVELLGSPLPAAQVMAGTLAVVHLVRYRTPDVAAGVIALLSAAVAVAALARSDVYTLGRLVVGALLLLGSSVALGRYLRSRDAAREQLMQMAVSDAKSAERMALARELHDVVAHHVTGIVVQAQAAKMVAKHDPAMTQAAFDRIEAAGTEAMGAMRRLVGSIRSGRPQDAMTEDATMDLAADLRKLVTTSSHGVPTELDVDLGEDLPPEVARSALRIVQEALTNVGKHATGATVARVVVGVVDNQLGIRVSDDGKLQLAGDRSAQPWRDGGYGLVGMRERVQLLRGTLSVGPAPDAGWVVQAWLPLEDVAP
ncbi:MAG: histidine kinase, partial [Thermocrispum sp.]